MTRVSIVEDNPSTRQLLIDLVNRTGDLRFVGSYQDGKRALAGIAKEKPDVVLMDVNLPEVGGIDCVRELKPLLPGTQFLMLTVSSDSEHIFDALSAGATGYLLKTARESEILAAIEQIREGGSPMTGAIARMVVQSFRSTAARRENLEDLSAREAQVLRLLAQGYLYKEIAETLSVSVPTVCTYIRRIYEKLHVRSRSQAVAKYLLADEAPRRPQKSQYFTE